jgi:hypothetical protein
MNTGGSTTTSPYILPSLPNVRFTSILTVGDQLPRDGVFAGKVDGIGAYDNGNGTITVLVNHEFGPSEGLVRDHGSTGSYVDRLVIDKATLTVLSADDLIQTVLRWDSATDSYAVRNTTFYRLCSSDLAAPSAFFYPATGLGTDVRIYLTGEETGSGRAFATLLTGPGAGTAYELAYLGNMAFENVVANPFAQQTTIVAMTDDSSGGEVYFYIGQKQSGGSAVENAGLIGGDFYGLRVRGITDEINSLPANGTFALQPIGPSGDVSDMSSAAIEAESELEGVTSFLRPEDCAWDPDNPSVFYFATTNSFSGNSRLYQVTFADITHPQLGGTITAVLDGSEGYHSLDNISVADGKVILQEDPGSTSYLARIWEYDIASDTLTQLAGFDPARFTPEGLSYITTNEESSGVIDVTALLGDTDTRVYLLGAQAHVSTGDPATVQPGQLLAMYVDTSSARNTVTFRNGNNYSGTVDTSISPYSPDLAPGSATTLYIDLGSEQNQTLLVFNDLFGSGPGQIPVGATITSATLTLNTVNPSATGASLYRMLADWSEQDSWNSLGSGIQLGTEALWSPDLITGAVSRGAGTFDVTTSVRAWLSGAATALEANAANNGWVFIAKSSDGWDFSSSESLIRPTLTVTYELGGTDPQSSPIRTYELDHDLSDQRMELFADRPTHFGDLLF